MSGRFSAAHVVTLPWNFSSLSGVGHRVNWNAFARDSVFPPMNSSRKIHLNNDTRVHRLKLKGNL